MGAARARAEAVALLRRIEVENWAANAGDCHAIMAVAARHFPPSALPTLAHVIWHESSRAWKGGEARDPNPPPQTMLCNVWAANPHSRARGLTQQMMPMHAHYYTLFPYCGREGGAWWDPVCHLAVAGEMSAHGSHWGPWEGAT